MGYNIAKFRDNIRFLEVITNRDGNMGGIIALFFDGAVCQFTELPKPDNKEELNKVYKYLESIHKPKVKVFFSFTNLKNKINKWLMQ